jgi:uncharacterized membrane protein
MADKVKAPESGGSGILGGIGRLLLKEAQDYAEARGERLLRSLGQRVVGTLEGTGGGGGSAVGQGAREAAGALAKGESPVKSVASGVTGTVKGALGRGGGVRKSTNIIEDVDVGVPISTAYNQWTQFQEFASFMKGVEGVDQSDELKTNWRLKIGLSRRSWEGSITEQVPDRRIAWTSQGAKGSTKGVVTFHPLADDLTKVIVVMEYTAVGPFEKVGNMMRLQLRRVRLDLREFKKFVSMRGEETGAWRGEIRDGEVVGEDQEGRTAEGEQPSAEGSQQPEAEDQQPPEPEASAQAAEEPQRAEEEDEEGDEETPEQGRAEDSDRPAEQAQPAEEDEKSREPAASGGSRRRRS